MKLTSNKILRFGNAHGTKMRLGPDGIHLFARTSGANLLIGEVVPPESMWAAAPRQVSIALTNTCDLSCSYCFAPKTRASLDFDRIVAWLVELDANGTIGVGFGGGEPTRYRGFADLCAHASRNTSLAVTFTTHGHHLDETLLAQLRGNIHFVRVSMDGIGSTYERLRGRSFNALARRMAALKEITPFGINYVVNSATLPDLDSAAEFAQRVGSSEFLLLPEQTVNGRGGITDKTIQTLREWVASYSGGIRLAVSEMCADGMPTSDPFEKESGLLAYAHIDATGVLKENSYALHGVPIDSRGVLVALADLRNHHHTTI